MIDGYQVIVLGVSYVRSVFDRKIFDRLWFEIMNFENCRKLIFNYDKILYVYF